MKRFGRWTGVVLAFGFVAAAATSPRPALALTLDPLASGGSFTTGVLTFSNFEVSIGGDLPVDLSSYPVQILSDGFRLSGPLSALFGATGTLVLSYDVSASDPGGILGVSVFAAGNVEGAGAQAYVAESLFGPGDDPLGSLFVYAVSGFGTQVTDSLALAGPTELRVVKTVTLKSGTFAVVPFVDQHFVAVPEPFSLLLMGGGLLGLARVGRRRAS